MLEMIQSIIYNIYNTFNIYNTYNTFFALETYFYCKELNLLRFYTKDFNVEAMREEEVVAVAILTSPPPPHKHVE